MTDLDKLQGEFCAHQDKKKFKQVYVRNRKFTITNKYITMLYFNYNLYNTLTPLFSSLLTNS